MCSEQKSSEIENSHRLENGEQSSLSLQFPYPFIFRNDDQIIEYIQEKLPSNKVVYYTKLLLGPLTLILPLFNLFSIYRSLIYQRKSVSDSYTVFHSIIFYGEFAIVHLLLIWTLIRFLVDGFTIDSSSHLNKSRWINLLDTEFTLMAFNMIKLVPVLSVSGFNFISLQMGLCASIFPVYSCSSQVIAFSFLVFVVLVEILFLLSLIMLMMLVKVYQVSFVGEISNPLEWTVNDWLLFIGFAANIINITDTPIISQLAHMWNITNRTWAADSNLWLHDQFAEKRKILIYQRILEKLGFIKTFFWVRTMSAIDLHCLVRLPPASANSSEQL